MSSDQIGFTVEDAPQNDAGSYMAFPTKWVDCEKLNEVRMQQGSANLVSPVIKLSGGIMSMNLIDPSHKVGAKIAGSFGSYNTHRDQSGDIGNRDMRAVVARSHLEAPHFPGPGDDHKQHTDSKPVKDWKNDS